ncbi:MAG: hypothetical protein R2883_04855 [Caldisericia bacterium]
MEKVSEKSGELEIIFTFTTNISAKRRLVGWLEKKKGKLRNNLYTNDSHDTSYY